jgi:hypothetical protein
LIFKDKVKIEFTATPFEKDRTMEWEIANYIEFLIYLQLPNKSSSLFLQFFKKLQMCSGEPLE